MARVLHLIERRTPRDMLDQLALLAGPEDRIVSLGPRPEHEVAARATSVHMPVLTARLAGRELRAEAGEAAAFHAWSLAAARVGRNLAADRGCGLVVSLPCIPEGQELKAAVEISRSSSARLTVPTDCAAAKLAQCGADAAAVCVLRPPAMTASEPAAARARIRAELGLTRGERLLVMPAEMVRAAGHPYAAWAHAILREIMPDLRLLMPGGGPTAKHARYFADGTGRGGEVFFSGEQFSIADSLAAADVALLPAERDCGCAAMAAAMAAGLPIVASDTPDAAECAAGGKAAVLVPPADPCELSAGLLKVLDDPALAKRIADSARRIAAELFDPAACRARLAEIRGVTAGAL